MSEKTDMWMPLVIGDYLGDTMHLTTEQHGAYMLLLMHYWRQGPLPNDLRFIGGIMRLQNDALSNAWSMLEHFFPIGSDGMLHNKRADEELAKASKRRDKAHKRAENAASTRWAFLKHSSSIPQELLDECPSPSPSPKKERGEDARDPEEMIRKIAVNHPKNLQRRMDSQNVPAAHLTAIYEAFAEEKSRCRSSDAEVLGMILARVQLLAEKVPKPMWRFFKEVDLFFRLREYRKEPEDFMDLKSQGGSVERSGATGQGGSVGRVERTVNSFRKAARESGDYAVGSHAGADGCLLPAPGIGANDDRRVPGGIQTPSQSVRPAPSPGSAVVIAPKTRAEILSAPHGSR